MLNQDAAIAMLARLRDRLIRSEPGVFAVFREGKNHPLYLRYLNRLCPVQSLWVTLISSEGDVVRCTEEDFSGALIFANRGVPPARAQLLYHEYSADEQDPRIVLATEPEVVLTGFVTVIAKPKPDSDSNFLVSAHFAESEGEQSSELQWDACGELVRLLTIQSIVQFNWGAQYE